MPDRRIQISNIAESEVKGHRFVSFDVAVSGHLISTVGAPLLQGRIVWSHAAIHGFCDFDPGEKVLLEAEVGRVLLERNGRQTPGETPPNGARH